jgi:1-aminocyclopropane-1-carboxylate deaminase/D-cysteine desulfhydrase-like pyridoxal-dependent ACC family enzyme
MNDSLGNAYPRLAARLRKRSIATLPTPVSQHTINLPVGERKVAIKHDDLTSSVYGGNKVRKLEYLLRRAKDRDAKRIATFGTVGSNHALATAIHSKEAGLDCTCFLAHQARTPNISKVLGAHLKLGTEIIKWGGSVDQLALYRRYIQGRGTWVIPLGGSCWLGALGFVNAGLELSLQIESGEIDEPDRIYIANGTLGSVAGLAIGLALANLQTEIHAVRVANNRLSQPGVLRNLIRKTADLLHRFDPSIPSDIAAQTKIVWRDEFYAGGYAASNEATNNAVAIAKDTLNLDLETTYTGKAMAALQYDLHSSNENDNYMFWNTYNSGPLPELPASESRQALPQQFQRYMTD